MTMTTAAPLSRGNAHVLSIERMLSQGAKEAWSSHVPVISQSSSIIPTTPCYSSRLGQWWRSAFFCSKTILHIGHCTSCMSSCWRPRSSQRNLHKFRRLMRRYCNGGSPQLKALHPKHAALLLLRRIPVVQRKPYSHCSMKRHCCATCNLHKAMLGGAGQSQRLRLLQRKRPKQSLEASALTARQRPKPNQRQKQRASCILTQMVHRQPLQAAMWPGPLPHRHHRPRHRRAPQASNMAR